MASLVGRTEAGAEVTVQVDENGVVQIQPPPAQMSFFADTGDKLDAMDAKLDQILADTAAIKTALGI